ncbi:hypothetical protein [Streptomyces prasinopilosus]|uniref:hypothetical protein n=1 Tax=Streptomyces prasinopilosus TaxID=67344 RepID=UPI0012FEAE6E|nr:hypothetical protein [Streptomyces prasinopilosus]
MASGLGVGHVPWQGSGSLCRGDAAWAWCAYGGQVVSVLVAGECVGWQATVVVQQSGYLLGFDVCGGDEGG